MLRRHMLFLIASSSLTMPVDSQIVEPATRQCAPPCAPREVCLMSRRCGPASPQVVRTASRVRADLDGRVVRYEVTETYVNRGAG